jgi:aminoglycoside phosphotransferase (APT) family kinase protein
VETDSLTKRRLDGGELDALVRAAFGPAATLAAVEELHGGTYNAAYAVRLDDGADLVLKVAPPPGLRLLTHEVDLMRTEVELYRRAADAGVPVPTVVATVFDRTVVGSDAVFLSRVPGADLHATGATLGPDAVAAVRAQAAAAAARLHTVTGAAYGYPLRGSRTWQPTWRAAFGAMVEDILADARRLAYPLPVPADRIEAAVRRHADALDAVDRPALVHFDLWDGNLFCAGGRLTGVIDGERAFYGDPVAELASLCLFRPLDEAPELFAGYATAGLGSLEPSPAVRVRHTLYALYLDLVMLVEGPTRGYAGPRREALEEAVGGFVVERVDTLLG